jgi:hypothetical protein
MIRYNIFHGTATLRSPLRTQPVSHPNPSHRHINNTTQTATIATLTTMTKPALLFVTARISDPSKTTDEKFNKMYNDEHLPDVLTYKKHITSLALRYKNTNPSSDLPYLALYPLADATFFTSGTLEQLTTDTRRSRSYAGADLTTFIAFGPRPYEKIQTYEGYGHEDKSGRDRGQTLTVVAMEPAEGSEEDFDAWYRKQHLDMLAMCSGYRRTTRYKRIDDVVPRFLALHEWACAPSELPAEQVKQVASTEWSKKIIGEAKVFDRDVFELIQAQGQVEMKL